MKFTHKQFFSFYLLLNLVLIPLYLAGFLIGLFSTITDTPEASSPYFLYGYVAILFFSVNTIPFLWSLLHRSHFQFSFKTKVFYYLSSSLLLTIVSFMLIYVDSLLNDLLIALIDFVLAYSLVAIFCWALFLLSFVFLFTKNQFSKEE